jgi:mono/diheme cytochrome c family protein
MSIQRQLAQAEPLVQPLSREELYADKPVRPLAEGEGIDGIYPNLANNAFVTTEDPAPAIEVMISGRAGMPRFSDDLSARQIAAILSFVRNGWGNDASAVVPDQVRILREAITRE